MAVKMFHDAHSHAQLDAVLREVAILKVRGPGEGLAIALWPAFCKALCKANLHKHPVAHVPCCYGECTVPHVLGQLPGLQTFPSFS